MTPDQWQEIEKVYQAALACDGDERAAYLDSACGGNGELRQEVESLLAQQSRVERFLIRPVLAEVARTAGSDARRFVGQQFAQYRIVSIIGAGGMGEVYKARDTRLGRDVALKILPSYVLHDPEHQKRFDREARFLAALNHPQIATIYGIVEADGESALAMELVDGPTLAERIADGPIPVEEALPIAQQIARALEAAHARGIVHRDLKPANVKVRPDGMVKVLDFGLAKAIAQMVPADPRDVSSPKLTDVTAPGFILGTPAYMAPEQAAGKPVDKRADLWAFGVVFMEMLTGRPVFIGETVSHVLAAVLANDPDWTTLPATTPAPVRRLLRRCLEKDPRRRMADAADMRLEIDDALADSLQDDPKVPSLARPADVRSHLAVGATVAILTIAGMLSWRGWDRAPLTPAQPGALNERVTKLELLPPEHTGYDAIVVSPNGREVAFTAGDPTGRTRIWIRPLDAVTATPLVGTEEAAFPFWSPDGKHLAFLADGNLKIVDAAGGQPRTICEARGSRGGTWGDGTIILVPRANVGLFRIALGADGKLEPLTHLDAAHGETSHRWPSFLPDGHHYLYAVRSTEPSVST
jgi:eukaryotic-like serine/threonine-protein kinase